MPLLDQKNPSLLIAMPQMGDPQFKKSVTLMLLHDAEGAMGLSLHHQVEISLKEFAIDTQASIIEENFNKNLYQGGPVGLEQAWVVHEDDTVTEKEEIIPGLYLSMSITSLSQVLSQTNKRFKVFIGYAGWEATQLETEMTQGAWLSAPVSIESIFAQDENLWENTIKSIGIDPSQLLPTHGIQ